MQRRFAAVLAVACVVGSTPGFARGGFAHGAGFAHGSGRGGSVNNPAILFGGGPAPQMPTFDSERSASPSAGVTRTAALVPTAIATRGQRLVLIRLRFSGEDQGPEAFQAELLGIVEIDADERIVARLSFDPDDFDAAFEELDARYLAGEEVQTLVNSVLVAGGKEELEAQANTEERLAGANVLGDRLDESFAFRTVRPGLDISG